MSSLERNKKIISSLKKHKVNAIGFVITKHLEDPNTLDGFKEWDSNGQTIGNHTHNHWNFTKKSSQEFKTDILEANAKLKKYKNFKKIFRFPYLKEGDTEEKRDSLRFFLKENEYINGHVTIDASDWYINMKLVEKIKSGEKFDLEIYRQFYLEHIWDRSQYYSKLAKQYIGRDIKHSVLLHHNLTTALFLDDLIKMYKEKGWKVINANDALKDPIYKSNPKTLPAGESLVWSIAKENGDKNLRYPAEDSRYEEELAKKIGL